MGSNPRFCIIGESWGPADALSASGAAAVGTTAAEAAAAKTASAEAATSGAAAKASGGTGLHLLGIIAGKGNAVVAFVP